MDPGVRDKIVADGERVVGERWERWERWENGDPDMIG